MFKKLLGSLFGNDKYRESRDSRKKNNFDMSFALEDPNPKNTARIQKDYFRDQIEISEYIRPEYRKVVLRHLLFEVDLNKTGEVLTASEKKELGLNTRQKFTHGFLEILTSEGIQHHNPKVLLENIRNAAEIMRNRDRSYLRAVKAGVNEFTLLSVSAGRLDTCEWCSYTNGSKINAPALQTFYENCTCSPYSASILNPIISF